MPGHSHRARVALPVRTNSPVRAEAAMRSNHHVHCSQSRRQALKINPGTPWLCSLRSLDAFSEPGFLVSAENFSQGPDRQKSGFWSPH